MIFILGTYLAEVIHLAFESVPFWDDPKNWDTPVYYLTNQIAAVTFIPAFVYFMAIDKQNKASKCLAFGLVIWNIKEIADEIAYMAGANLNVFEINWSFWGQTVFMFTVVAFSAYGYSKWKY